MNDQAWFRLLVSGIGLLLIGLCVPSLLEAGGWLVVLVTQGGFTPDAYFWGSIGGVIGKVFQLLFGVFLLRGGGRIAGRCMERLIGVCPTCGYDVRTVTNGVCPECGGGLPARRPGPSMGSEDARAD